MRRELSLKLYFFSFYNIVFFHITRKELICLTHITIYFNIIINYIELINYVSRVISG